MEESVSQAVRQPPNSCLLSFLPHSHSASHCICTCVVQLSALPLITQTPQQVKVRCWDPQVSREGVHGVLKRWLHSVSIALGSFAP